MCYRKFRSISTFATSNFDAGDIFADLNAAAAAATVIGAGSSSVVSEGTSQSSGSQQQRSHAQKKSTKSKIFLKS